MYMVLMTYDNKIKMNTLEELPGELDLIRNRHSDIKRRVSFHVDLPKL